MIRDADWESACALPPRNLWPEDSARRNNLGSKISKRRVECTSSWWKIVVSSCLTLKTLEHSVTMQEAALQTLLPRGLWWQQHPHQCQLSATISPSHTHRRPGQWSSFMYLGGRPGTMWGSLIGLLLGTGKVRSVRLWRSAAAKGKGSIGQGDFLEGTIRDIVDTGIYLHVSKGVPHAYIPNGLEAKPKGQYQIGDRLKLTVVRTPQSDPCKNTLLVSDKDLLPAGALQAGSHVDATVIKAYEYGVLFDTGGIERGRCLWKDLPDQDKDRSYYSIGVKVPLKVKRVHKKDFLDLCRRDLDVRPLRSFRIGQEIQGVVVTNPGFWGLL